MKIKLYLALLIAVLVAKSALAQEDFVVKDIQVNGLQRISAGTVYSHIPVSIGETFTAAQAALAIKDLFKTGFFKDVSLSQQDTTLIINVIERPTIAKIIFDGNESLTSDNLTAALKKIGLTEGEVFNQRVLDKVQQELKRQYLSSGKYGARISTEVGELTRNRVGIHINISEGRAATIKQINILGNYKFTDKKLLKLFQLSTSNWLSFYNKDDQYSKQRLTADLETLKSFYLNRGYINFTVASTQVAITPDRRDIYITINIKEGNRFTVDKVQLSGNLVVPQQELIDLVLIGRGEIFSRKKSTVTAKIIEDRLGNEGFVFAKVSMIPEIDDENGKVTMTFLVDPGKRAYVRRINITGNSKTKDEVLRREIRFMEASGASNKKIERSKKRLQRLGFFKSVQVKKVKVPGKNNQIDIDFKVTEKSSGSLSAGIGYSQNQGLILNSSVTQDNIFGSGKRISFSFNNTEESTRYTFGHSDPYFTLTGVGLNYDLGYQQQDIKRNSNDKYSTDKATARIGLVLPLSENDYLKPGTSIKYTTRHYIDGRADENYLDLEFTVGWEHNTLNRRTFPNEGGRKRLGIKATAPGSGQEYYRLSYKQEQFFPITEASTLKLSGEVAHAGSYGNATLPKDAIYYAGGVGSIRGFDSNAIGPREGTRYSGGSNKLIAKAEVFFPIPFVGKLDSMRMGAFIDAASISNDFDLKFLRYSVGISGEWISPFGPLSLSFALPLNAESDDKLQRFQINFGTGF